MPEHIEAGTPLNTFIDIAIASGMMLFGAYVLSLFLLSVTPSLLPSGMYNNIIGVYKTLFGAWDSSLLLVILAFLGMDVFISYQYPDLGRAFINIGTLLLFGLFYTMLRSTLIGTFNTFQFNQILPTTYGLLNNNYIGALVFFAIVICAGLNFRKKEKPMYRMSDQIDMSNYGQ